MIHINFGKEEYMGWAKGSRLAKELILSVKDKIKDKQTRKIFYQDLLDVFNSNDWDTQDECIGLDYI